MATKKFRRLRRLVVSLALLALVGGGAVVLKNFVLGQIRARIESAIHYGSLRLSLIPPAVILEDVRSVSTSPFFTAQRIELRISYLSLFRRDKPLTVFVDKPMLRVTDTGEARPAKKLDLRLPFSVENGYIRDGEFYYWSPKVSVRSAGFQAAFRQTKDRFFVMASAAENSVFFASMSHPVSGRLGAVLEGAGSDLRLHRLVFEGRNILAKASGLVTNAAELGFDLRVSAHAPAELMADYLDLPFKWAGTIEGQASVARKAGILSIGADVLSNDIVLNEIPMGRVSGPLSFRPGAPATLRLVIRDPRRPPEYLDLQFGAGPVEGKFRSMRPDPVIREIKIPWPVRSPVTGGFSVDHGRISAKFAFEDDPDSGIVGGLYPARGPVELLWDAKSRTVTFSSPQVETGFAVVRVDGRIGIGRDIDITIKGGIGDVKQGREFVGLLLAKPPAFPEIRGRGEAEVRIAGAFQRPGVKFVFSLASAGFAKFEAADVDGRLEIAGGDVTGLFHLNNPDMKGEVRLQVRGPVAEVRAKLEDGPVDRIFTALDLALPLKGRAAGEVTVLVMPRDIQVGGHVSAKSLGLAGFELKDVETDLEFGRAAGELSLSKLQAGVYGGVVRGGGRFAFASKGYELDLEAAGFDLARVASGLEGAGELRLKGKGTLTVDSAKGSFSLKGLKYASIGPVEAAGDLELAYRDNALAAKIENGRLQPGGGDFSASLTYPDANGSYIIDIKGRLLNPDLFLPWKGAKAEVGFLFTIRGSGAGPKFDGALDVKGARIPFPGFPHALTDFSGLVRFQDNKATLRSFQGRLAGGTVQAGGEIRFGKAGLELVDVRADAKDLSLALLDKTRMRTDGSLRLEGTGQKLALTGDFFIKQLAWRREFSEKFIFSASPYQPSPGPRTLLDAMALDVRLRADDNVLVENSLIKLRARFDLALTGTLEAPVLLGDIEGLGGELYFQDRKFRLLRARASFSNPSAFEPYIDFLGETFLKDYRVTFSMSGVLDRLRPEFASSPPLPPEDVLSLLALGESFKRTYSYEASSRIGTGSLLSFQLAEEAKKSAEKLFSLDSIRIDPFALGASTYLTARLTVGKKISRNIILLYSTNLSTQREELVRLEWELSGSFSLVGMRDEDGRLSLDAKIRKRF